MPTSATETRRVRNARGFTLFELLVVVAIVALLAGLIALSFGGIGGPRPEAELRQLADRIALVHDEAVLSGRTLGLRPTADGLEFLELALDPETRRAAWRPIAGDLQYAAARYAPPYAVALEVEGRKAQLGTEAAPPVILLPDGDMTPFRVLLSAPGATDARLVGAEDGALRIEVGE